VSGKLPVSGTVGRRQHGDDTARLHVHCIIPECISVS
jgi:hypothetical protein